MIKVPYIKLFSKSFTYPPLARLSFDKPAYPAYPAYRQAGGRQAQDDTKP